MFASATHWVNSPAVPAILSSVLFFVYRKRERGKSLPKLQPNYFRCYLFICHLVFLLGFCFLSLFSHFDLGVNFPLVVTKCWQPSFITSYRTFVFSQTYNVTQTTITSNYRLHPIKKTTDRQMHLFTPCYHQTQLSENLIDSHLLLPPFLGC